MKDTVQANMLPLMDPPPEPKDLYPQPRLDAVEGSGEDPLFECGVADAEGGGGFAGLEEYVCSWHVRLWRKYTRDG